jgi:hypothetical protein
MSNTIKLLLVILLFLCLAKMPYAYYELLRLIAIVGFGVLAYQAHLQKLKLEMIIFIALALLFQPFFKLALGKELWNIVDVIVGVYLIWSIFIKSKNQIEKANIGYNSNSYFDKYNDKKH